MAVRGTQQPLSRIVVFLLVPFTLFSACAESSLRNGVPAPTLTATQVSRTETAPNASASSVIPSSATLGSAASPTPPRAANPEIDYPLAFGNTWVFQSTRYQGYPPSQEMTATLVMTETVVDVQNAFPYFVAKIHQDRSAEVPVVVSDSRQSELRPAESGDYWLVLKGNRLYRQENALNLSKLEQALVKFVFPLKVGDWWPLTENQGRMLPSGVKPGMTRQVVRQGAVVVPAGRFTECFLLREEWIDAAFEDWFCPNVGIVESKGQHLGAPESWHQVLTRYEHK